MGAFKKEVHRVLKGFPGLGAAEGAEVDGGHTRECEYKPAEEEAPADPTQDRDACAHLSIDIHNLRAIRIHNDDPVLSRGWRPRHSLGPCSGGLGDPEDLGGG